MSILRDSHSHPHHSILHSPSSSTPSTASHDPCKPRSSSSRNDLFTTSWQPELPPPRPLAGGSNTIGATISSPVPSSSSLNSIFDLGGIGSGSGVHANTLPTPVRKRGGELGLKMDLEGISNPHSSSASASTSTGNGMGIDEFGVSISSSSSKQNQRPTPTLNKNDISPSPRTSSFFDTPIESITPPPAPRLISSLNSNGLSSFAPSPLTLSRSSSIRRVPPPLPISSSPNISAPEITPTPTISGTHTPLIGSHSSSRQRSNDSYTDPLSPLHQSPQLPPTESNGLEGWKPPLPPCSDDIELRLTPNSTYLLGEGRYARAYLAAYKRTKRQNSSGKYGLDLLGRSSSRSRASYHGKGKGKQEMEVNEDGDGLIGGSWKLCAAKRLAPDRESQTMGLREAFFLNRLAGPSSKTTSSSSSIERTDQRRIRPRSKQRAVSPLRGNYQNPANEVNGVVQGRSREKRKRPCGSVYVVKLIAVKEDIEGITTMNQTHTRSSSDILTGSSTIIDSNNKAISTSLNNMNGSIDLRRQRSSTIINTGGGGDGNNTLPSYPSLPSLAQSIRYEQSQSAPPPSLSRLVLLLEHAPLGTLDRMIRTSPQLIGKDLWGRWAREGAEALEWVHGKGVVHADVKPGNLLLTADLHIRLSDFGSSLLIHPAHPPTDGLGLGTLPFSPPELVDPNQTFSFPVDVFALGATLYQCLTGREPFRGIRTVEMMHHVRKGGLWAYEERERFQRVGTEETGGAGGVSTGGSPYPSAWRGYSSTISGSTGHPSGAIINTIGGGVRRAGSLRVPPSYSREHLSAVIDGSGFQHNHGVKPKLKRMTSAESIRASDEATSNESPSGVKLYANWVKSGPYTSNNPITPSNGGTPIPDGNGPTLDAITKLLSDEDEFDVTSPTYGIGISRGNSLRKAQESRLLDSNNNSNGNSNSTANNKSNSSIEPTPLNTSGIPKAIIQKPTPISPSNPKLPEYDLDHLMDHDQDHPQNQDCVDADASVGAEATSIEWLKLKQSLEEPYLDGSPSMLYLDGLERVSEEIRNVIKMMLNPLASDRLTAEQVRLNWDLLGVGLSDDDEDEDEN